MEKTNENLTVGGLLPFDPIVLIRDVAKRWLLILLVTLAVGVGTYILTDAAYEPQYRSNATFVVVSRGSGSTVFSNLSAAEDLTAVFTDLLNSSVMRKSILESVGATSFDGSISASVVPDTNLLNVTVTASDPRMAFLVTQAIIDHHEKITYQVLGTLTLEVLQSPTVPMGPFNYADARGQMKQMAMLACLVSILALSWLSFTRDMVRSGKEARKKLDCDYLGEIPHEKKHKTLSATLKRRKTSILVTNPITSFRFVETIRKLRHRVELHMHDGKVLMVTSLLENEGKSTVAVNLALSMAEKYENVLLIDCDLRKPACHAVLEQPVTGAFTHEILQGKARLADGLIRYKKGNLYLLLEKKGIANSGDLIASENMRALLDWARQEFDYVVLDLPPMSVVSDAEAMADLADASLLVIRQNAAAAPSINKAVATLNDANAKLLGCVLNNVYSTFLSSGQGYHYGGYGKYGHYGHYGHYDSRTSRK